VSVVDSPRAEAAALAFRPDVILLDIAMPDLDGLEVARARRRHPEFNNIKIIAVSGFAHESNRESQCLRHRLLFRQPVVPGELHHELDEEVKHWLLRRCLGSGAVQKKDGLAFRASPSGVANE